MAHKQGDNRQQVTFFSLESAIAPNTFVRVVDAFVDAVGLKGFGLAHALVRKKDCLTGQDEI
jgi:hypothetical protein